MFELDIVGLLTGKTIATTDYCHITGFFVGLMTCRSMDTSDNWHVEQLTRRTNDMSDYWHVGLLTCRTTDTSDYWHVGLLTYNRLFLSDYWRVGLPVCHHHYHHQSLKREGRWCATDDFVTSFLHLPLFSTALWDLSNSRPVHSLMLSSHLFLCLPCLLPPFTVPCKMVLARPDERKNMTIPLQFASLYDRLEV